MATELLRATCSALLAVALAAPIAAQSQGCALATSRFVADGPTVTDKTTGLVWSRCNLPRKFDPANGTCVGSAFATDKLESALAAMARISMDSGGPWRLPTVAELKAVFDIACTQEEQRKSPFSSLDATPLWSSSTETGGKTWQLDREGNKGRPEYYSDTGPATLIGVRDPKR